jgi:hypothetical protein
MKSKIFYCSDCLGLLLIAAAIIAPLMLGGCHKKNDTPVSSYVSTAASIGVEFEKKYHMIGGDTVVFHSNQTITESSGLINAVNGGPVTYSFNCRASTGNSISLLKDGVLFKIWIDSAITAGTPFAECSFMSNIGNNAKIFDTCNLGTYLSGAYIVDNKPTLVLTTSSYGWVLY